MQIQKESGKNDEQKHVAMIQVHFPSNTCIDKINPLRTVYLNSLSFWLEGAVIIL